MRVLVVVLLGLVVVLAVLTELCLLQAAATRRRIRRDPTLPHPSAR